MPPSAATMRQLDLRTHREGQARVPPQTCLPRRAVPHTHAACAASALRRVTSCLPTCAPRIPARTQVAEAPGYRLLGASLTWRLNPTWETTLTADNLADASYRLDNGLSGALGTAGPGRNVRISLSARY